MAKAEKKEALAQKTYALFEEFRSAYGEEWRRLERAERIYCGEHWFEVPQKENNEPRPVTPVIQSTVENIAADMMDSYPETVILPETPEDEKAARILEEVIKQNHDAAGYEREYRALVHDLLVGGYAVQEIGYDPMLHNGFGGAFIRHTDNRSILFDPLCTDFQDGRGVIKFALRTKEWLMDRFPQYLGASDGYTQGAMEDRLLYADRSKTALFIEYWWREYDKENGRSKVHMAQLAGGQLLNDSREKKPEGFYAHGQYPFTITKLFARKGSPLGYGLVDMFYQQQVYADKLNQIILKNALMASHNKLMITEASGFDPNDLRDWAKEVHVGESLNGVNWFSTPPLPAYMMQYSKNMLESIKEESGSNDFSRGGTTGGITAASAIAALQEMSSKRSRMATKQMHEAYKDAVRMEIEVEREFYVLPRTIFVTLDGKQEQNVFDPALFVRTTADGRALPIEFAISIKVQKKNTWSVIGQNELVLQMLQLGVLKPEQAVELMHFEGKEQILKKVKQAKEEALLKTEYNGMQGPGEATNSPGLSQPAPIKKGGGIKGRLQNLTRRQI